MSWTKKLPRILSAEEKERFPDQFNGRYPSLHRDLTGEWLGRRPESERHRAPDEAGSLTLGDAKFPDILL